MPIGDTKNRSSICSVYMPDLLIEALEPHRQPSGYLVTDKNGNPLENNAVDGKKKGLRAKVRQYTGLPELNARGLQHSYATMLNEAGIDMKAIGVTMGHTKVSTTEGHVGRPETGRLQSIRNAGINHIWD